MSDTTMDPKAMAKSVTSSKPSTWETTLLIFVLKPAYVGMRDGSGR